MLPQIIILVLGLLDLGVSIGKHGEPKKPSKYNAITGLIATVISWSILYWGGFFDVFWK